MVEWIMQNRIIKRFMKCILSSTILRRLSKRDIERVEDLRGFEEREVRFMEEFRLIKVLY